MADIKISEMTSASVIEESDNIEISQEVSSNVFMSFKASILAIANKIASGINFTSTLKSTDKTLTGAINEKVDWESNGILGAKNLNSYPYYHTSRPNFNGIDWVDVGDGTWTAQGTASANSSVYCHNRTHPSDRELFLPNGDYRISGCPSGGGDSTYSINIDITTNGGNNNIARDYGEGATFSISGDDFSNKGAYVRVSLTVFKNYAITGTLTFEPMIRLANDTDTTWRPYAMTNKELTDVVNNVPLTAGTYSLQAVRNSDNTITYSWV